MAEKKTTRKATKKVVEEPTKEVVQETPVTDLVPHQTYSFVANGKGGMQKDRVYKVSGVVATALLKSGLGKLTD